MTRPKLSDVLKLREEGDDLFEYFVDCLFSWDDNVSFVWTDNPWRWVIEYNLTGYDWEANPYSLQDDERDDEWSSQIKHDIVIEEREGKYQYRYELQHMESHAPVKPDSVPSDFFHSDWVELDGLLPIVEGHWETQDAFWEKLGVLDDE